jgi:hypothetical protein
VGKAGWREPGRNISMKTFYIIPWDRATLYETRESVGVSRELDNKKKGSKFRSSTVPAPLVTWTDAVESRELPEARYVLGFRDISLGRVPGTQYIVKINWSISDRAGKGNAPRQRRMSLSRMSRLKF